MTKHRNPQQEPQSNESPETDPIQEGEVKEEPQLTTIGEMELEALKRELNDCKDKYLRTLAESENARKRLAKEKIEMTQYAIQNAIVDFLNPIDHMENALNYTNQMSEEVKHWAVGFQMILTQFKDALASHGVTTFVSVGTPFDPHFHEAIETVASTEYAPGIVVVECLKGYKMGDRVIRPARVKVSKAPEDSENNLEPEIKEI